MVRKRLGEETFDGFERAVIERLVERKLIKPRGVQSDAMVFESEITYPLRLVCFVWIRFVGTARLLGRRCARIVG